MSNNFNNIELSENRFNSYCSHLCIPLDLHALIESRIYSPQRNSSSISSPTSGWCFRYLTCQNRSSFAHKGRSLVKIFLHVGISVDLPFGRQETLKYQYSKLPKLISDRLFSVFARDQRWSCTDFISCFYSFLTKSEQEMMDLIFKMADFRGHNLIYL